MANTEKVFKREDGSEAKIKFFDFTSWNSKKPESQMSVFHRPDVDSSWIPVHDTPERKAKAKNMDIETYIKEGREPMFYVVSIGEILKAGREFDSQYKY